MTTEDRRAVWDEAREAVISATAAYRECRSEECGAAFTAALVAESRAREALLDYDMALMCPVCLVLDFIVFRPCVAAHERHTEAAVRPNSARGG